MKLLSNLCRDKAGNILVIAAVALPVFIGAAGLATDTIMWTLWKREAQRSADSAAMAGALTVQQARVQAEKAAVHDFKRSVAFQELKGQIWFENAPKDGPYENDDNAVRVRIRLRQALPFSSMFLSSVPEIEAYATATMAQGVENCLLALDQAASGAVTIDGNAQLALGCGIMSNSSSSTSVAVMGSSTVQAPVVSSVGGIPNTANFVGDVEVKEHVPPLADPYRLLPKPTPQQPCNPILSVPARQSRAVQPGCYQGMKLEGEVTFSPGVYYVTAANLEILGQARVSGQGVTFILTNTPGTSFFPQLAMDGQATVRLSAPTEGDYKGVLFYQDRDAPTILPRANGSGANFIAGGSGSLLGGAFYFPKQVIRVAGGSGIDFSCFKVVAYRLLFTGGGEAMNPCSVSNDRLRRREVRLVG